MKLDKLQEAYDEMFDFITDLPSGLDGFESDFDAAYKELLEAKSAEDAPVVHGKWIRLSRCDMCSVCNYKTGKHEVGRNFCPECGAKLDLEEVIGNIHDEEEDAQ